MVVNGSYSVGTRRPCIIEPSLIERCSAILNVDGIEPSNHDQRMVAEILLYSTLYRLLHRQGSNERRAGEEGGELELWREQWDYLFRILPFPPYYFVFTGYCETELTGLGQEGHQYIEIGYYFAHLMLHAQALKLLDDGKQTPIESGSPASAARTPSDMPSSTYDAKKTHMSAISQLSTQILSRARRVEITEIRVPPLPPFRGYVQS
jgi:hypothetical protein